MDQINLLDILGRLGLMFPGFLFALCFHEWAHGWVALKKGDSTAMLMGRLTLNPAAHMDMWGTFIIPLVSIASGISFIGWAKPVPVNSRNLKDPVRDLFWISLAGPLSNVFLAFVGSFLWFLVRVYGSSWSFSSALTQILDFFVLINLVLAIFNMIPLHPLDGGKVMARFLPSHINRWLEEHQFQLNMALIVVVLMGGFQFLAGPIFWLHGVIKSMVVSIASLILG